MKPAIAKRRTTCRLCGEPILKGTLRLDDIYRYKNGFTRVHFHSACYTAHCERWFEQHRGETTAARGGGRPPSKLTPDEALQRKRLLSNLNSLWHYYLPKISEALSRIQQPPTTASTMPLLTAAERRRLLNFALRFEEIATALQPLGGLPPKYSSVDVSSLVANLLKGGDNCNIVV